MVFHGETGERQISELDQYLISSLADVKNYFHTVGDIEAFHVRDLPDFLVIWDRCFGEEGYMNVLPDNELRDAKKMISDAYVLAEYAHFGQERKQLGPDGRPLDYITHVLAVTQGVVEYDQIPRVVASALLHDVFEDSGDNGHPIDDPDIIHFFGDVGKEHIVPTVRALSEVQISEKNRQKVETLQRIIESGIIRPEVILIKIQDRLHNMRTMDAMPLEKQLRKAEETYMIYTGLARRFGYKAEADELAERSIRIMNMVGGKRLTNRIDTYRSSLMDAHSHIELEGTVRSILAEQQAAGLTSQIVDVAYPTFEDIYNATNRIETAKIDNPVSQWRVPAEEIPITLSILAPDDVVIDPSFSTVSSAIWMQQRQRTFLPLALNTTHFDIPKDNNLGYAKQLSQIRSGIFPGKTEYYLRLRDGTPLTVNILTNAGLISEITPIAALTSVYQNPDVTKAAQSKLDLFREEYENRSSKTLREEDIRDFGNALYGNVPLYIERTDEKGSKRQIHQSNDSSYFDVLLRIDDWFAVSEIKVNGKPLNFAKEMGNKPSSREVITFTFDHTYKHSPLTPAWADDLRSRREQRPEIYKEIIRIYETLPDNHPFKIKLKRSILNHGWDRIIRSIRKRYVPANLSQMDPRIHDVSQFLFDVGTNVTPEHKIKSVRRKILRYSNSLTKVVVKVSDVSGVKRDCLNMFYPSTHVEAQIPRPVPQDFPNLIHDRILRSVGGNFAKLIFYFDPADPHLGNLERIKELLTSHPAVRTVEIISAEPVNAKKRGTVRKKK